MPTSFVLILCPLNFVSWLWDVWGLVLTILYYLVTNDWILFILQEYDIEEHSNQHWQKGWSDQVDHLALAISCHFNHHFRLKQRSLQFFLFVCFFAYSVLYFRILRTMDILSLGWVIIIDVVCFIYFCLHVECYIVKHIILLLLCACVG